MSNFRGISDPRGYGSKNPGATNVFRSGDWLAGLLTFLGDFTKGYGSVVLASLASKILLNDQNFILAITVLVSIAVVVGHIYPIFYDFKGGKGVATTFGVLLAISFTLGGTGEFCVGNYFPYNKDFWFCSYINCTFSSGNCLFCN